MKSGAIRKFMMKKTFLLFIKIYTVSRHLIHYLPLTCYPPKSADLGGVKNFLKVPQKFRSTLKIFSQKFLPYSDSAPENSAKISAESRLMSIFGFLKSDFLRFFDVMPDAYACFATRNHTFLILQYNLSIFFRI